MKADGILGTPAENARDGHLTEEEASKLVDELRQEVYEESYRGE